MKNALKMVQCPKCDGIGEVSKYTTCDLCGGKGEIPAIDARLWLQVGDADQSDDGGCDAFG